MTARCKFSQGVCAGYSMLGRGFIGGIAFVVLVIAGCSVSQPFPDRAAFVIPAGHPKKSSGADATLTLRVMPMHIAKPFDSQLFNYKIGPAQFTQDYYAGFVAPPERLLGAQLIDWLNDSGAVKYAAPAGTTLDCSANLETQVTALYADHTNNTAVIEMRIFVISDSAGPARVLLQKVYSESEPIRSLSPDQLVIAWSAAYQRILQQMAVDIGGVHVQVGEGGAAR